MLDKIVAQVRRRVAEQKMQIPEQYYRDHMAMTALPDFFKNALSGPGIRLIGEIKKASPSAGVICPNFNPEAIARVYADSGAAAISVLTETDFFQGSLEIFSRVRSQAQLPLLRKDFIIDPYQVYQSRYYGADGILLIAAILTDDELARLNQLTMDLCMNALVEIHHESELEKALAIDAQIIGINNRDLRAFQVDLATTFALRDQIPQDRIVVSESGIKTRAQVQALEQAGIHAILVGETLMRQSNRHQAIAELMGNSAA